MYGVAGNWNVVVSKMVNWRKHIIILFFISLFQVFIIDISQWAYVHIFTDDFSSDKSQSVSGEDGYQDDDVLNGDVNKKNDSADIEKIRNVIFIIPAIALAFFCMMAISYRLRNSTIGGLDEFRFEKTPLEKIAIFYMLSTILITSMVMYVKDIHP